MNNIKGLLVMLVAGLVAAWLLREPLRLWLDDRRYRLIWVALLATTTAVFVAGHVGLMMLALAVVAVVVPGQLGLGVAGVVGMYLGLSAITPQLTLSMSGLGPINQLLDLPIPRALSLLMIVPLALRVASTPPATDLPAINWRLADLAVVAYELLGIALEGRTASATHMVRLSLISALDILLPYYVVSRGITSWAQVRALLAVFCATMGLVVAATFVEQLLRWPMYSDLQHVYGQRWVVTWILERGGLLRVRAMTPQPLLLGYLLLFALAYWLALTGTRWRERRNLLATGALLVALYFTVSRGPLMAGALLLISLLALGTMRPTLYGWLLTAATIAFATMVVMGWDDALVQALKQLLGDEAGQDGSIDYRKLLLETSLVLIAQNPWLGASDYYLYMEHLRQGEGIIDLVNTYVHIALAQGLIGLALFLIPYVVMIRRLLGQLAHAQGDDAMVARALISLTVAALFMLFTASFYWIMPQLNITLVALGLACSRLPVVAQPVAQEPPHTMDAPWSPDEAMLDWPPR